MHSAIQAFRIVNIPAYIALAVVAVVAYRRRRDQAARWAAIAFGSLGLLEILALIPNHQGNLPAKALERIEVALLVLFPFLLFRFTTVFRRASRELDNGFFALTALLLAWTFAMPHYPQKGEHWPASFVAFIVVFLIHWTALAFLTATRLWRAGREQPSVARRRMEMLAFASAAITLAIFLVANTSSAKSGLALGSSVLGTIAVVAFYLGLSPPRLVRLWWRYPEQQRLQQALSSLLTFAETQEEVAGRVLRNAAELVGARTLAIRNVQGEVVGQWSAPGIDAEASEPVQIVVPNGPTLELWTSPYAPFFGEDELDLLQTLGALTGVALDRVRLFEAEHEARVALERANEVQASFIALAAHELRTPMTTIHGFVTTLHHLADRLDESQVEQVKLALLQQTQRMASLIEQLLDLSRVDADAIPIEPKPLAVRAHVREIVESAAADPGAVEVDVAEDLVATVDRNALDRIVSNLVTNAFRYGRPPVVVKAEQNDRHFRLIVQDSGPGVSAEFVPDLFERFSRSQTARSVASGTGLGLAIARSYARAHGGDLLYEEGVPSGARFQLVLPQKAAE